MVKIGVAGPEIDRHGIFNVDAQMNEKVGMRDNRSTIFTTDMPLTYTVIMPFGETTCASAIDSLQS